MAGDHKRIAYILYNERPTSGLVRGQVITLLKEIKRRKKSYDITVIALWQPWIHLVYRAEMAEMRKMLRESDIAYESWPLVLLPSRYFMYDYRTLPLLYIFAKLVFRLLGLGRFHLVHARSYFPSLVLAALKQKFNYKLIFDMRSLWPEEFVTVGKWTLQSETYYKWKAYERFTVERCDAFTAVSEPMKKEANRIFPGKEADLITLLVDVDRMRFNEGERGRIRAEKGWQDKFVVVYQGSLAFERQWNNIHNYAKYFKRMESVIERLHMVMVVPEIFDGFLGVIKSYGIDPKKVTFERGAHQLASWLSAADAGIHVMSPGPDGHTRLGVKVVEYLSCGLPVITNSHVGAAAEFVTERGVGIRLDLEDADFDEKLEKFVSAGITRDRCRNIAERNFSLNVIGDRYAGLYERLLGA